MADTEIKQRIAFKAVIANDLGEVLMLRESNTYSDGTNIGKFGLPGGRLNPGEAWQDGLSREIMEETGLRVEILRPYSIGEWRPVIKDMPHQIIAIFMICRKLEGTIQLSEEHDQYRWLNLSNLTEIFAVEPDRTVVMNYLQEKDV